MTLATRACARNDALHTSSQPRLAVAVLFTSVEGTLAALKSAGAFSRKLDALIRLIGLEVVPYPLSFSEPPRSPAFSWQWLEKLAAAAGVHASIEVYLCRDRKPALRQLFAASSILVLGGPRRWWRGREERLGRWLEKQGHSVMFVATG